MRWDIINYLVNINGYQDYLEVGVQDYYSCCDKIQAPNKTALDPAPRNRCDFVGTSDSFFAQLSDKVKYDIVFVDGLHHDEQVTRDIINSLEHLRPNGVIVVHDCLPNQPIEAERDDHGGPWMGDVYKAMIRLINERNDLDIVVINHDCGCGIIKFSGTPNTKIPEDLGEINYNTYDVNRAKWLNVVSIEEFQEKYKNPVNVITNNKS